MPALSGGVHEHLKRKQTSESWLLKQAIRQENEAAAERRAVLTSIRDGLDAVDDSYIPDLRPVSEGEVPTEPDPVSRGFAFHRHQEGNSPPVEPKPRPLTLWDKIRRG